VHLSNRLKLFCLIVFFRVSRELIGRPLLLSLKLRMKLSDLSPFLPKHLSLFQKHGVVVVEDFMSQSQVSHISKEIDHCITPQNPRIIQGSDKRLFNAEDQISGISSFSDNYKLERIGCAYLGTPIKLIGCMVNLVPANQSDFGSGGSWHRDANFPQFKAMIYLSDVLSADHGAFAYIPKSNRITFYIKEFFSHRRSFLDSRWSESEIASNYRNQSISIVGKAGTLILFDTCLLHRGNPNTPTDNRARYAATNYYRSIIGKFDS